MMIGLVSDEYPPARVTGGIGTYSRALAGLLTKSGGHEVHVFCQGDGIEKYSAGEEIHPVVGWSPRGRPGRYLYYRLMNLLGPVSYRVRWGIAVGEAIRKTERLFGRKFDVVEVPEAGGYGVLLRLARVRSPLLVRLHAGTAILRRHSHQRMDFKDCLIARLERWSVERADLVTSPSRALVRESRCDLGVSERDCLIYPNVLPRATARTAGTREAGTEPRSVLVVGRLGYLKGTDLVLEAMRRLQAAEYPDLHLVLIGRCEGPRDRFAAEIARTLRPGTYDWVGEVDHGTVLGAMKRIGLVVQASRFENYPTTILEALQSGCLVIGSTAGGIPEIIADGRTGLLFDCGCAESLSKRLKWALENPEECARIAQSGKEWVESELSDSKVLHSVIRAYEMTKERAMGQNPLQRSRWRSS